MRRGRRASTRPQVCPLRRKRSHQGRRLSLPFLRWKRLGFPLEGLMLRRFWPIGAIVIGARLLFGHFLFTTATRQSFFDGLSAPLGLILIIVGGYVFTRD